MFTAVMVYTRGSASDYDDWEIEHGNIGWGSRHLIPLLKKVCIIMLSGTFLWFSCTECNARQKRTNQKLQTTPMEHRVPSKSLIRRLV